MFSHPTQASSSAASSSAAIFSQLNRAATASSAATTTGFSVSGAIEYSQLSEGKKLGEGAFATVSLGTYQGKPVAIKQFKHLIDDAFSNFNLEKTMMEKLQKLQIPHVVAYLGYSEDENSRSYRLVMEYAPQGDLCSVLKEKRNLDWSQCYQFLDEITYTVKCLHEHNILHCDLSMENILLGKNNEVILADFGLAVELTGETYEKNNNRCMRDAKAPEVASQKLFSRKSDVYALGSVIFQILIKGSPEKKTYPPAWIAKWATGNTAGIVTSRAI